MSRKQVLRLLIEIEGLQKQLRTWKKIPANQIKEENKLYQELRKLIRQKNREIMEELKKLDRIPTSDVEIKGLLLPLTEAKEEYNNIVMENTQVAIRTGMERTKNELKRQGFKNSIQGNMPFYLNGSLKASVSGIDFDEFSQDISNRLREQSFVASEQTIDRMTGNVMDNLKDSFEQGYGIDRAAENLGNVFDDMEGYELERVARTEINGAQNLGAEATMIQLGVQYDRWRTAGDGRVRGTLPDDTADHVYMDGQISLVGSPFSNGLTRPGDRSGPIKEWISCRCTLIPYLMPEGYIAPAMSFFYESDLVKIEIPEPKARPKPGARPERIKIDEIKPPWKPTMTPEEAEEWAKGTLYGKERFYHGTTREAADRIIKNGFDLKETMLNAPNGKAYGAGHYLGKEGLAQEFAKGGLLEVKVKIKKVATEKIARITSKKASALGEIVESFGNKKSYKGILKYLKKKGGFEHLTNVMEGISEKKYKAIVNLCKRYPTLDEYDKASLIMNHFLKEEGYDALVINNIKGKFDMMVVLDDKVLTVVKR